jgi:LmbE family N-acetylglucosaminyl deacetylase
MIALSRFGITQQLRERRIITRLIRQWNADIVIANRPNDYHPDHRYTSILVQDLAYMVTVPFFCPDGPLKTNLVFLYASDQFQRPNPFRADVTVAIDDVIELPLDALLVMESQIHEGARMVTLDSIRMTRPGGTGAVMKFGEIWRSGTLGMRKITEMHWLNSMVNKRDRGVRYAQAFEVCEYGRQPSRDELKRMFPF